MDPNFSPLERAFALAASGRFHKVSDIRLQLHREGYNHEIVQGPVLTKQLVEAMQAQRRGADEQKVPAKKPDKSIRRRTSSPDAR